MLFDKKTSGSCKQMGAVRSPAVSAEWSPCGRLLLTATTAPRLRVDNNVKVFTYYGARRPGLAGWGGAGWKTRVGERGRGRLPLSTTSGCS